MKCRKNYGYHSPEKIDERPAYKGSKDEYHVCKDCGESWIFRMLPNGKYYQEEEYLNAYAKDLIQPYHEDFERIYGSPKKNVEEAQRAQEVQKELAIKKEEIKEFKSHKKIYGI